MSFSFDEAMPVAVSRLGYAELLALLRDREGGADTSRDPRTPDRTVAPRTDALATTLLADVLLGRPGWRAASLALGGCFRSGGAASQPVRKPI